MTPDLAQDAPWSLPRWLPAALVTMLVAGAMAPLADPDLPMHLAVGRWIVAHREVPTIEPFAWTRPGAPYFAYSWLAQTVMYLLMHTVGPIALRVLHGSLFAGAFWAMLVAGRQLGWTRETSCVVAALHLVVFSAVAPLLRPQEVLFVLMPLAWTLVARALGGEGRASLGTLSGLALIGAIAVNTHLFFPVLAAPLLLAFTRPHAGGEPSVRQGSRRGAPAAVALALGYACSPYLADWMHVFQVNFRENALFGPSSLIAEHRSGFSSRLGLGVALSALPLIASGRWTNRERVIWGAMWVAGLVVFALRTKGLLVWWLVALPLVGLSAAALLSLTSARELLAGLLAFAIPCAVAVGYIAGVPPTIAPLARAWRAEQARPGITLSSPAALATDTLIVQLAARASAMRVLTVFDFGSYLTWRAPGLSASIDGRTIFPDSAALPDVALDPAVRERPLGPWRSADAAIVPLDYPVATVLDTARGWRRYAEAGGPSSPFGAVGLWSRDAHEGR
jgi:hypothetical protein